MQQPTVDKLPLGVVRLLGAWRGLFMLLAMLAGAGSATANAFEMSGYPHVVDADTISIKGQRIRLLGIDAPEQSQLCKSPAGDEWYCGLAAMSVLIRRIGTRRVYCEGMERDRHKRPLAVCYLDNGLDLNGWLVRRGWAVSYARFSTRYKAEELDARQERRGMWKGTFEMPWEWRRERGARRARRKQRID